MTFHRYLLSSLSGVFLVSSLLPLFRAPCLHFFLFFFGPFCFYSFSMVYGGLLLCLRFRMLSSFPPLWRSLSALKKYRSDRISRSRHCFTPFLVPNWSMFHYLSFAHTCRARGSQHRQLFGQRRFWPPKKYRLGCWNHPNDTRHLWWAPALWCGHVSSFWRFVRHLQDNISGRFFLFRESRPQIFDAQELINSY